MLRANSLKKALRQIIEQAEKGETEGEVGLLTCGFFFLSFFGLGYVFNYARTELIPTDEVLWYKSVVFLQQ